ncbi:translation initiation factor-like protein eif-2b epsilon subunit [Mytilinidion resinicola]|uniref:Mannose-1-phosphate guanyltransferase n=1 Tax=Mytilinidion resinicola TaxID=574789 RepID=A0A6A6YH19_9PEZI|nr:translation initiation factor-like protein eif-2b epsilon subunit [Mytilinidion resinicola]KAF2807833.1 translation initiation factor-like protein eif-2b epsilon subunit [Mytilinidion resinicola]
MGPKGKKGQAADKAKSGEVEREDPLQAVILADPFETRFNPFTLERPRCLLPLANTPLIEYTFEFLANAGVEEVFVYCGAHTDLVDDYVQRSKWSSLSSPFSKINTIHSTAQSIGDAMRDLDKKGILTGDFLLVYGDVVSNLPLESALAAHRARRAANKDAIMTMVLREAGTTHRTKAQGTCPVFVIDPRKDRCLHFEQMPNREHNKFLSIDPGLLSSYQELDVRQDLIDCGIDICTPDVLALWSDNFDFQAPRKGFLHSVLKDYDLNGKTIHTHIVTDHYAARVRNLHAYDSISKDIVSRWAYPLCPDSNLLRGQSYRLQKGNIYKEQGVILARSCIINRKTVIGRDTSVGEGSVISNSIIGRGCVIGRNVAIDGAYIWDNTRIGDGSSVKRAILASEVSVGRTCKVEPGALISYGVTISDGMTIGGDHRITRAKRRREKNEDVERGEPNIAIVGQGGDGFEYLDDEEEDEDEVVEGLTPTGLIYNLSSLALSTDSISTLNSNSESDISQEYTQRSASGSFVSIDSVESESGHAKHFDHDAASSIYDSLEAGHESANIQLELTSLRMSLNASEHQVRRAVAVAFVKRVSQVIKSGVEAKQAVAQVFDPHKSLLKRISFDKEEAAKVDQVDFLLLLQKELASREKGDIILLQASMKLYQMDVLQPEAVEQWWADAKATGTEALVNVRQKTQPFIEFLENQSEEDSEGESEEESELE